MTTTPAPAADERTPWHTLPAEEVFARIEHDERLRARAVLRAELGKRAGILDARIAEIAADQAFEVVHRTRAEAVAA